MIEKLFTQVNSYFDKYAKQAVVALKVGKKFIMAMPGADIAGYSLEDKLEGDAELARAVLNAKKSVNAIIISAPAHAAVVSQTGVTVPAVLDDFAQIVGPSARCGKPRSPLSVLLRLKGRNACLLYNNGALAAGRTLDEADTAMQVLEKGCKAFIESTMLGGAKPISKLEAALMHIIYRKKYSKADQFQKLKEIGNE